VEATPDFQNVQIDENEKIEENERKTTQYKLLPSRDIEKSYSTPFRGALMGRSSKV
jgi:hypothetical protein